MPETPHVFSDRYEMVRHIARGGMAQVYLARDLLLDRPVALKVLFPELSVDLAFVERFRREARAAANLSHPNIVSVFDWGQGENTYFIVMEYVDGPTLSTMLRSGPLPPAQAAHIAASVAAALDFAHRRGVIHRDVKPGNVLIDSRSQVKVADFGIARAAGTAENLTQTGSVMGTATYFSPEQAQGYPVDPRSDVYSLGVVLYEMVAGRAPFSGDNPVSIAYKHVKEQPELPSTLNPAVPAALEAVIMKCLAKEPDDRYRTAEDLRADLVRFTSGEPVLAGPVGRAPAPPAATNVMGAVGTPTGVMAATSVIPAAAGGGAAAVAAERYGPPGGPRRQPAPPPPERSRGLLYGLLAALLVALLVGGYFGGRQLGLFGPKTLTVPGDLKGQMVQNAVNELSGLGFTNVKTATRFSATVPANQVIGSQPAGGSRIKSNANLTLLVSGGAVQVAVPDVHGLQQAAADQKLTAAGFVPTDTTAFSATVAKGVVISTAPAGNTKASQGSHVQVVVSGGTQPVQVPSVVGDDPAVAGQALAAAQLKVSKQTFEASTSIPAGQVTRTDPPAGATEPAGTPVVVYVSSGIEMPDLSNQTQSQAQSALSAANLTGQFTPQAVTDPRQNGLVIAQNPAAGTTGLQSGQTVQVTIGQYTAPSTTTSTSTTSTTVAGGGTG